MKEVNFVLYFGANRGENALNNPQTVTTYANSDAVTREKENFLKRFTGICLKWLQWAINLQKLRFTLHKLALKRIKRP